MITPYEWQQAHINHLVECFTKYPYCLDGSDTGTGKTVCALAVARRLGQTPLVITPKSVITAWRRTAEQMGVELLDVLNVDKLKAGKTPWLTVRKTRRGRSTEWSCTWNLKPGTLVIWDEAHQAGGLDSQNSTVMLALKAAKLPTLLASATLAENPLRLKAAGFLLGLHRFRDYYTWCRQHGCVINPFGRGKALMFTQSETRGKAALKAIHEKIYPSRGSRMRAAELKDFPENFIMANAYDLPDKRKIDEEYADLDEKLHSVDNKDPAIVLRLRAKQNIELLKVPVFLELVNEALEENRSAVVFVNFRETAFQIQSKLKCDVEMILGGQSQTERDEAISRFQADLTNVIICMIQAGGVGISLHDLQGRPRTSFISPPDSAKDLVQALGRIHRAGAKSKAVQNIVFIADTVEEQICENVRRKINNLSALNDGDLAPGAGF